MNRRNDITKGNIGMSGLHEKFLIGINNEYKFLKNKILGENTLVTIDI